jgi:[protein-PII] uridylyltransferase
VARADLRVALGLLPARHVAGDAELTTRLRLGVLADWRAAAGTRLAELQAMHRRRAERSGELAFLLEPDLKEARGGLRDVGAISAIAAAWVAPGPGPRVRAAHGLLLDARHALHEVTGRAVDRLVLQEQDEVARLLELPDADALLRGLAGAGRTVAYALDQSFRQAQRSRAGGQAASSVRITLPGVMLTRRPPQVSPHRRPLAEGLVEQEGEVVLARSADPATDPVLVLRAAAAAAQAGLALAPSTVARLACCPPLPVPWPAEARDRLAALLGAGPPAVAVWEALDQEELITRLLPDWERVRNRPQRNPLHTFTVDRHLVETAAHAAALTRTVARPDLLLISALLHDIGKGWPGDHRLTGEVVARVTAGRLGYGPADAGLVASAVRHHLLLPQTATRRDLDDPMTVTAVTKDVTSRPLLALLHALAIADARATGPAAWNDWKAGLIQELVARVAAVLGGEPPLEPLPLRPEQVELAAAGEPAAIVRGAEVTVAAPDRPGLLWQAAGVLAAHRLAVRSANASSCGEMAVAAFTVAPQYGEPPDPMLVTSDLRRALAGQLDVAQRLAGRGTAARAPVPAAPPEVRLVDGASGTATVVEVRARDAPGLLWRIGRALGECGLDVRAARVETLGAEAVDVFYVIDAGGRPVNDAGQRGRIAAAILSALAG